MHTPRSNLSLVVIPTAQGVFLNAVAGVGQVGQDTVHLDTVEVAKVTNDCEVGEWTVADYHLKGGRSSPQAVALGKNIAVIGGWGDLDLLDIYDDVQITISRPDGTPSPWRTSPAHLTSGIYGHATALVFSPPKSKQSLLLNVGGQPGTGAYANWISYGYADRELSNAGIWRIAPSGKLPTGLAGLGVSQVRNRLYVIGGTDGSGQYHNDVVSAEFDLGRP